MPAPETPRRPSLRTSRRLWSAALAAGLSLVGASAVAPAAPAAPVPAAPTTAAAAPYGAWVSVAPARVLDTRSGLGTTRAGAVGARQVVRTPLAGRGGLPPAADIAAVVVNLTATLATSSTFLTAYPSDVPLPTASSVNVARGVTTANLVTLPLHADGSVSVYNASGSVHVVMDVLGYYTATDPHNGNGGLTTFTTPYRKFDSRNPATFTGGHPFPDGDGVVVTYDFGPVVNSAITALVVTVTVVTPTASGYAVAWDGAGNLPGTSTLNFAKGRTVANLAIIPKGDNGGFPAITAIVRVPGGTAHLLVDAVGLMTTTDPAAQPDDARFVPLQTPTRLIDTRSLSTGGPAITAGHPRGFGQGVLGDTSTYALAGNLTAVNPTAPTFLTVYPSDISRPEVSSVNVGAGQIAASGTLVQLPFAPANRSDEFRIFNAVGSTNVLLDVAGTFQLTPPPVAAAGPAAARTTPAGDRWSERDVPPAKPFVVR